MDTKRNDVDYFRHMLEINNQYDMQRARSLAQACRLLCIGPAELARYFILRAHDLGQTLDTSSVY